MKKLLPIIFLLILCGALKAQNKIQYAYDAAGNRITRTLVVATKSLMANEEPEVINEIIAKREVKIYSSVQGQITVEISNIDGLKKGTITIYSFPHGNIVLTRNVKSTREDLDISSKSSGIYILVVDLDGEKTSLKLMKN